ncbi:unnamed protein product, partial [Owenia fusiformis]
WPSLEIRRKLHRMFLVFKVNKGNAPNYVSSIFAKFKRAPIRDLRLTLPYHIPAKRSSIQNRSCVFSCLGEWNSLEPILRECINIHSFKRALTKSLMSTNITLASDINVSRSLEIYLNRIRVDFIFKAHLHAHNFVNILSPDCACGHTNETTIHVFFSCPIRQNYFITFEQQLCDLNIGYRNLCKNRQEKLNFILYGHETLKKEQNIDILKLSAVFIRNCVEGPQAV